MSFLRPAFLTAAVIATSAGAAASASAATVISTEPAPTQVAAYHGVLMWSQLDPSTGNYRLVKSTGRGDPPVVVPVPQRAEPFDIDLGSNRSGSIYAVYTRDGDIFRMAVASGVETKITKLSSPTLAERDPTIMRGEIGFIRREGSSDQLRVGDMTSASTGSRFLVKKPAILSAEIATSHVAYVEQTTGYGFGSRTVHVRNLSTGHDQSVYVANSGGANFAGVTKPAYADDLGAFVWARTNNGSDAGNRIVRYTLRGSRLSYGQGSSRWNSLAWTGVADLGAVASSTIAGGETVGTDSCQDAGRNYCTVEVTGPVSFTLKS
jgi:hypothetical protein